ncbi:hypothetical protein MTO96_030783 [Rhipicephalus appendiculatus]
MPTVTTGGPEGVVPVAREDLPGGVATPTAKAHSGSPTAVAMIDQKATGDPPRQSGSGPRGGPHQGRGRPTGNRGPPRNTGVPAAAYAQ